MLSGAASDVPEVLRLTATSTISAPAVSNWTLLVRHIVMEALHVPAAIRPSWLELDPRVHAYLHGFLTLATPELPDHVGAADLEVPPTFHNDLIGGAPRLRAAFPALVREVVSIDAGDHLLIRIACEGTHDGPFFGFMLATGRTVRFDEVHTMRVRNGRVVEDHVTVDMRLIIRQLARA
jgi:predicted ester cyclase